MASVIIGPSSICDVTTSPMQTLSYPSLHSKCSNESQSSRDDSILPLPYWWLRFHPWEQNAGPLVVVIYSLNNIIIPNSNGQLKLDEN